MNTDEIADMDDPQLDGGKALSLKYIMSRDDLSVHEKIQKYTFPESSDTPGIRLMSHISGGAQDTSQLGKSMFKIAPVPWETELTTRPPISLSKNASLVHRKSCISEVGEGTDVQDSDRVMHKMAKYGDVNYYSTQRSGPLEGIASRKGPGGFRNSFISAFSEKSPAIYTNMKGSAVGFVKKVGLDRALMNGRGIVSSAVAANNALSSQLPRPFDTSPTSAGDGRPHNISSNIRLKPLKALAHGSLVFDGDIPSKQLDISLDKSEYSVLAFNKRTDAKDVVSMDVPPRDRAYSHHQLLDASPNTCQRNKFSFFQDKPSISFRKRDSVEIQPVKPTYKLPMFEPIDLPSERDIPGENHDSEDEPEIEEEEIPTEERKHSSQIFRNPKMTVISMAPDTEPDSPKAMKMCLRNLRSISQPIANKLCRDQFIHLTDIHLEQIVQAIYDRDSIKVQTQLSELTKISAIYKVPYEEIPELRSLSQSIELSRAIVSYTLAKKDNLGLTPINLCCVLYDKESVHDTPEYKIVNCLLAAGGNTSVQSHDHLTNDSLLNAVLRVSLKFQPRTMCLSHPWS